jgi:cobalt-zinc-cadmium efflux system membrane fusion protein
LENPEYIGVQQAFLEARGRLTYLKSDYERQKTLREADVTSQKNFLKAESEYLVTQAQYQSLIKQLSLMNINASTLSPDNLRSVISVVSPLSGFVTSIPITQGMYVNPSDVAMTITNMTDMHIELQVFEKDLPYVKEGQAIRAKLQSDVQKVVEGKVHFINKSINGADRSVAIHGDLVHSEDIKFLTPGMYIEAEIVTDATTYPALPTEAIAHIEQAYFVLVKESETTYKKKLVHIGLSGNGYTQIINASDFEPGTEFLTKGVFNLITE